MYMSIIQNYLQTVHYYKVNWLALIIIIMQDSPLEKVYAIYVQKFRDVMFQQIEHAPDQFLASEIILQEGCLCINHSFFSKYYDLLMKQITLVKPENLQSKQWAAQVLLCMNGQNDKAWNIKKQLLNQNKLDLKRQLRFNAAVCYKNKKSSSYYNFRFKLYQQMLRAQAYSIQQLKLAYQIESKLIDKILTRFFRNYYCWMFRNRLYNLFHLYVGEEMAKIQVKLLHKFIDLNPNDYSAYSRLIAVIQKSTIDRSQEIKWLEELDQFCKVAFTLQQSYHHISTYRHFLSKQGIK